MIELKRIYEPASESDGERFLVERLWARGVSKDEARLAGWLKDLAPSPDLRQWYAHDTSKWEEFRKRYRAELNSDDKQDLLDDLLRRAREHTVTLVYAARDTEHNSALILKDVLEEMMRSKEA